MAYLLMWKWKNDKIAILRREIEKLKKGDITELLSAPEKDFSNLPYDETNLEFPKKNLEIGRKLGSGAFGVVYLATMIGVMEPDGGGRNNRIVAVKMTSHRDGLLLKEAKLQMKNAMTKSKL